MFQSTPARGGRHAALSNVIARTLVSIHARTRRATEAIKAVDVAIEFQSTPARGGRPVTCEDVTSAPTFQSTPARGGRHGRHHAGTACAPVSIHARTRRATRRSCRPPRPPWRFNPRPHAAGDLMSARTVSPSRRFQSTPARGGRLEIRLFFPFPGTRFQSTPARGGRPGHPGQPGDRVPVSIHARTRRATLDLGEFVLLPPVSIHARTRRATPAPAGGSDSSSCFNPRPHAAGDAVDSQAMTQTSVSIHARTRRATTSVSERP